jgi:hypothetical protein
MLNILCSSSVYIQSTSEGVVIGGGAGATSADD